MVFFWSNIKVFLLILCLSAGTASAETPFNDAALVGDPGNRFLPSYGGIEGFRQPQAAGKTFSLGLGPKILELKTYYLERSEEGNAGQAPAGGLRRRYFDVLATSSQFDGKLVGEGELAYSMLGLSSPADERPAMFRVGLKGRLQSLSYGADYKSFGKGFVSMTGARFDHAREEGQVWGEYSLGALRLRGSFGELWEKTSDHHLMFTKTAATSLNFTKSGWSGTVLSSYSVVGEESGRDQDTAVFTNAVTASYRPLSFLAIEPHLSFKEEWPGKTGWRTETPAAGLALVCTPLKDLQLTGRALFARALTRDGLDDSSTVDTAAGLNWRIGKSRLGERFLSFQIEYHNQLYFNSAAASQERLVGTIELKFVGF